MELYKLRVISVSTEPTEVVKISFELIGNEPFPYCAGQFLTLVFDVNGKEKRRSYSFCSSPAVNEPLSIAVKLVENGEISRFLHHRLCEGDILTATAANGQFIYEPVRDKPRTIFLLAAGVGITPLFSILKTALLQEQEAKLVLIYSNRYPDQVLFSDELNKLAERYTERFSYINLYSQHKNLRKARLNNTLLQELVKENMFFNPADALFYSCGPVDYMDMCRITLLSAGYRPDQVKRETFVLPEDEPDEDDFTEKVVDKNTYSVILHFNGKVHELEVPYPKRILEVALENRINLPYSCSGGVCSTCSATCIKGGVRMDYNEVLTDEELAQGRVLVCTGHPVENGTTIVWE